MSDRDCRAAVEIAKARECNRWVGIKGAGDEHATLFDARGAHSLVFELENEKVLGYRLRRDGEGESE